MPKCAASDLQCESNICQIQLWVRLDVRGQVCAGQSKRRFAPRRGLTQLMRTSLSRKPPRRRLLDDDMRIGSADAERAHTRATRHAVAFPRRELVRDVKRTGNKIDRRIRRGVVQGRWNRAAFEDEDSLDQTGHAGGAGKMTKVRFDRTDPAEPATDRL